MFNRNGQKLFRNFSLIIFSKIIIPDNSLQDLHEVPEHLRSARKRHRSALCDALPDKEVPSVWSISDNSCKKIISAIQLNPLFKKNLCISVGEYSLYSSYCFSLRPATFGSCSQIKICVHLCSLWENFVFKEKGFNRTFLSSLDLNHVGQKTQNRRE